MSNEQLAHELGRFGHHPEPAIDFCIEVESLESIVTDKELGLRTDEAWPTERIEKAFQFRVGGDVNAVDAKHALRQLDIRVRRALRTDDHTTEPSEDVERNAAQRIVAEYYDYENADEVSAHCAEVEFVLRGMHSARAALRTITPDRIRGEAFEEQSK